MDNNNSAKRIHPLVAGAAISLMLLSLVGVAAITGLLPTSHSNEAPLAVVAQEPEAATPTAPATPAAKTEAPVVHSSPAPQPRVTHHAPKVAQAPVTPAAPAVCNNCGQIESVQAIKQAAQPSGLGMVAGAVLGGVLGNQVGGGTGRKVATVAGAVGGGYAGNEVEKRTRSTTTWEVRVRMDNGEVRTFPYQQQPSWNSGDRVRVVNGQLTSNA